MALSPALIAGYADGWGMAAAAFALVAVTLIVAVLTYRLAVQGVGLKVRLGPFTWELKPLKRGTLARETEQSVDNERNAPDGD